MNKFKNLKVWQQSVDLTAEIYKLTSTLPSQEKYGLCSQINRSAVSIPSNIAKGSSRSSNKEYCHFLSISQGSAFELETQLIICQKLKYFDDKDLEKVLKSLWAIQNMLFAFHRKKKSEVIIFNSFTFIALISSIVYLLINKQ